MAEVYCGEKGACLCNYISAQEAKVVWCQEDISINELNDMFTDTNIEWQDYAAKRSNFSEILKTTFNTAGKMFLETATQFSTVEEVKPTATLTFDVMGIKMTLTLATATVALIVLMIIIMFVFIIRKVVSYI